MKKIFTGFAAASALVYVFVLYYMLFRLASREMVITSEEMLDNYNYWNSVNLIPFKTITEYITAVIDGSVRGHAIRNLAGNLFLLFPLGFYLPFFVRKMSKFLIYSITTAVLIIAVEIIQVLTMAGGLDIDDFILNFAGALIGFLVFVQTPIRALFKFRSWKKVRYTVGKG